MQEIRTFNEISMIDDEKISEIVISSAVEIEKLEHEIQMATFKAEAAKDSALVAKEKVGNTHGTKNALQYLQGASSDLAEAQVATVEAQKISFQYQKRLGEITKYLLGLGCVNIANNRAIVEHIKLILSGDQVGQLSEETQKELISVVKQLKSQEDIMIKQEKMATQISERKIKEKEIEEALNRSFEKDVEQDVILQDSVEANRIQDNQIQSLNQKYEEVQKEVEVLSQKGEIDKLQDTLIDEASRKNIEQDQMLQELNRKYSDISKELHDNLQYIGKDYHQDGELSQSRIKNEEQDDIILMLNQKADSLEEALKLINLSNAQQNKKISWIAIVLAIVAIVLSIIGLII